MSCQGSAATRPVWKASRFRALSVVDFVSFAGPRSGHPMNDQTISVLRQSLAGLAQRQRALTDNLANLETPDYLAKRVDFESSLRQAIAGGDPSRAQVAQSRSMEATGVNGNNVNLDVETVLGADTALRYQLSVEALNAKYRLLRTAIRGQG